MATTFAENDDTNRLTFDGRHDFVLEPDTAGIAVALNLCNGRNQATDEIKGIRRRVSLTLVDATDRCVLASKLIKVNIPRTYPYFNAQAVFTADESPLKAGHTYRIVLMDENAGSVLSTLTLHMFDTRTLGLPERWYTPCSAGIRPESEDNLYRAVNMHKHEGSDFKVRFELNLNMDGKQPLILPELELRVYYPENNRVETYFAEPRPAGRPANLYFIETEVLWARQYTGTFYAEVLCMEYPIAGCTFSMGGSESRGEWTRRDELEAMDEYTPDGAAARHTRLLEAHEARCRCTPPFEALRHLTGIQDVKDKLAVYERVVRFNRMRSDCGLPVHASPLHAMFLGSPGTGKTTVARMMGLMLHRAGLLSKGHVVVRERATLLGQNYNAESEKTLEAIEEARGGILLIDEAYQLCQPHDPRDPGKFVIETLLTALADESRRDWMLVLAGYPDAMRRMLDMNPGFKSRIPGSNIYTFADFTGDELLEIAERYLSRAQFTLSAEARHALRARLGADHAARDKNFGNARHVINLILTEILPAMAVRVTTSGDTAPEALTEIQAADIPLPALRAPEAPQRVGFAI